MDTLYKLSDSAQRWVEKLVWIEDKTWVPDPPGPKDPKIPTDPVDGGSSSVTDWYSPIVITREMMELGAIILLTYGKVPPGYINRSVIYTIYVDEYNESGVIVGVKAVTTVFLYIGPP